jgi:hypothetical protein
VHRRQAFAACSARYVNCCIVENLIALSCAQERLTLLVCPCDAECCLLSQKTSYVPADVLSSDPPGIQRHREDGNNAFDPAAFSDCGRTADDDRKSDRLRSRGRQRQCAARRDRASSRFTIHRQCHDKFVTTSGPNRRRRLRRRRSRRAES